MRARPVTNWVILRKELNADKKGDDSAIFITEGASDSIVSSRVSCTRAIFSLRGKSFNIFARKRADIYKNKELYNLMMVERICIRETPLFRVRNKKETRYCYSPKERNEALEAIKNPEPTRFKGPGRDIAAGVRQVHRRDYSSEPDGGVVRKAGSLHGCRNKVQSTISSATA